MSDDTSNMTLDEFSEFKAEQQEKKAQIYSLLASGTSEALMEVMNKLYRINSPENNAIRTIVASSYEATPEVLHACLWEAEHGFKKPDTKDGGYFSISPNSYRANNGKLLEDIDDFKPVSVQLVKTCLQSPCNTEQTLCEGIHTLYQIGNNVAGSNHDVFRAMIAGVNNDRSRDSVMIAAVWKASHLNYKGVDTNGVMDVFAAVADEKNAYKHTTESVDDFFHAIATYAKKYPQEVADLTNKMLKHEKNDENSVKVANKVLAMTRVNTGGKISVHTM